MSVVVLYILIRYNCFIFPIKIVKHNIYFDLSRFLEAAWLLLGGVVLIKDPNEKILSLPQFSYVSLMNLPPPIILTSFSQSDK